VSWYSGAVDIAAENVNPNFALLLAALCLHCDIHAAKREAVFAPFSFSAEFFLWY